MTLPDGLDPDEFLAQYGADELQERAASAGEAWRWKFEQAVGRHGLETLDGRDRVLEEMLKVLAGASAGTTVRLDMLLATISQRVGVSEEAVRQRLSDVRNRAANRQQQFGTNDAPRGNGRIKSEVDRLLDRPNRDDRIEVTLLEELLASPEHFSVAGGNIAAEDFRNQALSKLFRAMTAVAQGLQGSTSDISQSQFLPNFENVMAKLTHPELKRLLVSLNDRVIARHGKVPPAMQMAPPARRQADAAAIEFPDACPPVLRRPIEQMHWRREEQSHRQLARQLDDPSAGLRPDEAEEVLRQAAKFHSKRASGGPR